MGVAFAVRLVCSPVQCKGKGWAGAAGAVQRAPGAARCRLLSSPTALAKSLTWGFGTDAADVSVCVVFSALFVRFSRGEPRGDTTCKGVNRSVCPNYSSLTSCGL